MTFQISLSIGRRLFAGAMHLAASLFFLGLTALLVFFVWYPYPYSEVSGGEELYLLIAIVDAILGPLITLIVFDWSKPRNELRRDMALVVFVQLLALLYGLWTVYVARPIHMVFEYDRFRVVHAIDIEFDILEKASKGFDKLPLTGPTVLGLRPFNDVQEEVDATIAALQGIPLSSRPELWQPYDASRAHALRASKPLTQLLQRFPDKVIAVEIAMKRHVVPAELVRYVPLVGRKSFWTVLLDGRNGDIVGFLPIDSF